MKSSVDIHNLCKNKFFIEENEFIYLNSSQESLRLKSSIETINNFNKTNGITYDGLVLSSLDKKIDSVRKNVSDFFNSNSHDIIFTSNTTASINIISKILESIVDRNSEIIVTDLDHISNISPWKVLSKKIGGSLKVAKTNVNGVVELDNIKELVNENTKIISLPHLSNTYSSVYDVKSIVKFAKSKGIITVIDGAQAVGKIKVDILDIDCDFYVTSTHKMFSGTGGIIIGRKGILSKGTPYFTGGKMNNGLYDDYELEKLDSPYMYESGTKNIANILSVNDAIEFLKSIDVNEITKYLINLKKYAQEKLEKIDGLKVINKGEGVGNVLFNIEGHNHEDIRSYLDSKKIITRSGFSCSNNLNEKFNKEGFIRISMHIYNSKKDIDSLYNALLSGGDFIEHLF